MAQACDRLDTGLTSAAHRRFRGSKHIAKDHGDMGRSGEPVDVGELAWAVELLLDPEADLLHGSVLYLDAGGHRGIH